MKRERIFAFCTVFSLLLCGVALALYLSAPKSTEQRDSVSLYSGHVSVPANGWNYLRTPEDGIAFFVNNASMLVQLHSGSENLVLHIMDDSQFEDWKMHENASNSLITEVNISSYDYAIEPKIGDSRYFVFENPEAEGSSFDFSATVSGDFLRFDFGLTFLYLVVVILSGMVFVIGLWQSSPVIVKWHNKWAKPRVKTRYSQDNLSETDDIYVESASLTRKMVKYGFLSLFAIIVVTYIPFIEKIPYIVNFHFYSSDYNVVLYDYFVRTFIFRFFTPLPTAVCVFVAVVILIPRLGDLNTLVQLRLHLLGPKQSKVSRELWAGLAKLVVSKTFIGLMILLILPLILLRFVFQFYDNNIYLAFVASMASIFGLFFGSKTALLLVGIFDKLKIKDYAWRHFMFGSVIPALTMTPVLSAVIFAAVAFNVSGYYMNFLSDAFFSHIRLLQPFSLVASNIVPQNLPVVAAAFVAGGASILFLLIFTIPFLYRFTVNELFSAVIVFVIVEGIQELTRVLLVGTFKNFFEPLSIVAPILAAVVATLLHNHFRKMVKRIIKRSSQDNVDADASSHTRQSAVAL